MKQIKQRRAWYIHQVGKTPCFRRAFAELKWSSQNTTILSYKNEMISFSASNVENIGQANFILPKSVYDRIQHES